METYKICKKQHLKEWNTFTPWFRELLILITTFPQSEYHTKKLNISNSHRSYLAILIYGKCTLLGRNTQEISQKLEDAALP